MFEAEIFSRAHLSKEAIYFKNLMSEIGISANASLSILGDNEAMIKVAASGTVSDTTKHIVPCIHAVHEAVSEKIMCVSHVESARNSADPFTKSLPPERFAILRDSSCISSTRLLDRGVLAHQADRSSTLSFRDQYSFFVSLYHDN